VNLAVQPRKSLRFRGRSFMALLFAPEPPLDEWFSELDAWSKKSPGYFIGRPIILDVAALALDKEGLAKLIADLHERDIRIMGVEGTKASWLGLGMPPLVSGSRAASLSDFAQIPSALGEDVAKQPEAASRYPPRRTQRPHPQRRCSRKRAPLRSSTTSRSARASR